MINFNILFSQLYVVAQRFTACPTTRHPGQVPRFDEGLTNRGTRAGIQKGLFALLFYWIPGLISPWGEIRPE